MFRMNKETEEILEGGSLNKRQLAAQKRQRVYRYLMEHPDAGTNVELATAAGYNMNVVGSSEYQAGNGFIWKMVRDGYLQKETTGGMTCFYLGDKEPVETEAPVKTSPLNEAKEILEDAIEDYDENMGPEGQSIEDWATDDPIDDFPGSEDFLKTYDGCLEIADPNNHGNKIIFEFRNKSHCDIVNIIENLNMEDLI